MRKRATIIVMHRSHILLVQERGHSSYTLPGGAIDHRKDQVFTFGGGNGHPEQHGSYVSSRRAAIRELEEELGLIAQNASFLFHYEGQSNRHSVYLAHGINDYSIRMDHKELSGYEWWDGNSNFKMGDSTSKILKRFTDTAKAILQEMNRGI